MLKSSNTRIIIKNVYVIFSLFKWLAGTNLDSGITGDNSNNNFPPQIIPILSSLGSYYRVRPATIFPSDPMIESTSVLSS